MSQISINVALAVMAVVPVVATVKVILHYVLVSNNYHVPTLAQQVRGKHILVTGASKGLGKAIAIELAKAGADVTLMARGQDRDAEGKSSLDHAANECRAAAAKVSSKQHTPGTIRTAAVDAGRYEEVVEKVREVVREAGAHPYWIIANAGGATPGFLADQTNVMGWNAVDSMMTQNYMTAVNVVRAALVVAKEVGKLGAGAKVADDRGRSAKPWSIVGLKGQEQVAFPARVVLVGSVLSVMSFIGYSSYSASKYALRGLADGLRSEFAAIKTRVHMYLPANMDTPGFAKENETKPKITAQIEGTASTMTAEKAGQVLLGGVLNERYFITNDILGELIRVVSHGPAPRPNPVTEALALPFISLILSIWVYFSDWDVSSHFSKAPAVEAKKDKKNK
ncbi:3-dehydrosphinganine reductase [Irineochytrium annulatum]|nr:3-dehydrosphinganine reductase [Irineochytrium annulatum]